MCNKIEGSYDKIIITIVSSYTGKKNHSFVAVGVVTHTARNSLVNISLWSYAHLASSDFGCTLSVGATTFKIGFALAQKVG